MKDRIFFPIAFLLAGGLVLLAMLPTLGKLPTGPLDAGGTDYSTVLAEGKNLHRIIAGGDSTLELVADNTVLRITADAGALNDDPEQGPHFKLAPAVETQFAGYTIRITVTAKPADDAGAMQFAANYRAGRVGESGWKDFTLQPGWKDYSFEYNVPPAINLDSQGFDYFAIRPIVPDKTRTLEVKSVRFDRLKRYSPGG